MTAAPRLFALDCEMCATTSNPRAVVLATLVNDKGEVVLDMHVRPDEDIVELRTELHGLTLDDIEVCPLLFPLYRAPKALVWPTSCLLPCCGSAEASAVLSCEILLQSATATWQDFRKALLAQLAGGAVLVGHGLHHDLRALHLDYWPVIDTARIFTFRGLPADSFTPSLSALAQAGLGVTLHEPGRPHNARDDALAALKLAQLAAAGSCSLELDAASTKVAAADTRKLLVHRLPAGVTRTQLEAALAGCSATAFVPGASKVCAPRMAVSGLLLHRRMTVRDARILRTRSSALSASARAGRR